jgi:hypothetical protein
MVDIDVGYERFLGPEMFFHPVSQLYSKFLGIYPQGLAKAN